MTSVLTVVAFARSLNTLSSRSGAPCRLTARAAMQSLLRHAHTETPESGRQVLEASVLPRAAGSIRAVSFRGQPFSVTRAAEGYAATIKRMEGERNDREDRGSPRVARQRRQPRAEVLQHAARLEVQ